MGLGESDLFSCDSRHQEMRMYVFVIGWLSLAPRETRFLVSVYQVVAM